MGPFVTPRFSARKECFACVYSLVYESHMDILPIINAIGGGLPAVVIAFLGWAFWSKSQKVDALQELRLQEAKELLQTQNTVVTSLGEISATFRELSAEIRSRGVR